MLDSALLHPRFSMAAENRCLKRRCDSSFATSHDDLQCLYHHYREKRANRNGTIDPIKINELQFLKIKNRKIYYFMQLFLQERVAR